MKEAIADRPWIWLIVGGVFLFVCMATFVFISVKYGPKDVPVSHQQCDY
jgi:drug/metabolite transporter (DMT)-like permease